MSFVGFFETLWTAVVEGRPMAIAMLGLLLYAFYEAARLGQAVLSGEPLRGPAIRFAVTLFIVGVFATVVVPGERGRSQSQLEELRAKETVRQERLRQLQGGD